MTLALIAILSTLSYATGFYSILKGKYKPSVYSRLIWLLLAINGFVGVTQLHNSSGIILFSALQTLGSLLIFLGALRFSILKFGKVEAVSTALLILSLVVWVFGTLPALNVAIGLVAHFIGALPTFRNVYRKPSSENLLFWLFFAVATGLAFITAGKANFEDYMFPLYFAVFNTGMVLATLRGYLPTRQSR